MFKVLVIKSTLMLILISSIAYSQKDAHDSNSISNDIFIGYSYDNLSKHKQFIDIGTSFIDIGTSSYLQNRNRLSPVLKVDALVGFAEAKNLYAFNISPAIRYTYGAYTSLSLYVEANSGVSFVKNESSKFTKIEFVSGLDIGCGYKNISIFIDLKYIQNKDIFLAPISFGVKYRIQ